MPQVLCIETIHLRSQQIFTIFDPYPRSLSTFFYYYQLVNLANFLTPPPPKKCRRLKWMVLYQMLVSKILQSKSVIYFIFHSPKYSTFELSITLFLPKATGHAVNGRNLKWPQAGHCMVEVGKSFVSAGGYYQKVRTMFIIS